MITRTLQVLLYIRKKIKDSFAMPPSLSLSDQAKLVAAKRACEFVQDGMLSLIHI